MNLEETESFEDKLRSEFTRHDELKTGFIESKEVRKILKMYLRLTQDEINKITSENSTESSSVNYEGNSFDIIFVPVTSRLKWIFQLKDVIYLLMNCFDLQTSR